jgi:hypothetical protein
LGLLGIYFLNRGDVTAAELESFQISEALENLEMFASPHRNNGNAERRNLGYVYGQYREQKPPSVGLRREFKLQPIESPASKANAGLLITNQAAETRRYFADEARCGDNPFMARALASSGVTLTNVQHVIWDGVPL